ncbi:hypothetical protein CRG98_008835 [Punica granatum]|uniref:Uncharacterized protein n=1 Tax=Punica granatum TaxID=22663 RepID=A0A2I0KQJ5_PUNGR|nr:hypothetical protein CRG98_008835 [Punica granatum]
MDEHTRQICKMHESADWANLRSVKERMHGRAHPADLQDARVSGLGELAKRKRKDARASRPRRFARSTNLQDARVSGLGELAKRKRMHRRPVLVDLQQARVIGLGELVNRKRKDAQRSGPGTFARSTGKQTRRTCEA